MKILRSTRAFTATPAKRPGNVTIQCRNPKATPHQRTVNPATWQELNSYTDATFDACCCLDLGIGNYLKPSA